MKLRYSVSYLLAILLIVPATVQSQHSDYDVVIHGARVLDGTGNPWFRADLGLKDGRIASVGNLKHRNAKRVIDATGMYVAPGFIDIHSHSDAGLFSAETKHNPNVVAQGVTTVVVNQDGRSPWPLSQQKAKYEQQGIGTNVVLLVGHGTVRARVMKDDYKRPATPAEIEEMKRLVKQGMEEGAFGLSAGLEYVPGRWSATEELVELVKVVVPYNGFYISHERSEGRDPMWKNASDPSSSVDLLQAVNETILIGEKSGATVVASHLKAKGATYWGSSYAAIRLIEDARARGVRIYVDQYPYPTSGSDGDTVLIPAWALAPPGRESAGQLDQPRRDSVGMFKQNLTKRLLDPETRAKIRRDIEHEIDRRGGADNIVIYQFPHRTYIEKSVGDIARLRKEDPVDTAIWIQLNGLDRPGGARMRGFSLSEIDIEYIMKHEYTATCSDGGTVAMNDGVPHPRFYGTFPRKIHRYAITKKTISLASAIRSMTSLPAQIIGLKDRGQIREGFWADIAIFDPAKIRDTATYVQPHQYPEGVPYVFVNGVVVVDGGKLTVKSPGKVLRLNNNH